MLLAASESAVTKKPRLRLTMRRSSSVRPRGSFHSWISRLMLISCGIQWFAQAARYFSQAHLYLKGTSWLTSALELMTRLSSTDTRRCAPAAGACAPGPEGTKADIGGWTASPGIPFRLLSSSKFNMRASSSLWVAQRPGEQHGAQAGQLRSGSRRAELRPVLPRHLALGRLPLRLGGKRHFVRRDVQVPLGAGDGHPLRVARMRAQRFRR